MSKPEILIRKDIPAHALDQLETAFTVHKSHLATDPEAFLGEVGSRIRGVATFMEGPIDKAFIDRLPRLEIVASFGVGYDQVDAAYAAKKGVVVSNTPDVLSDEVADTAMALFLMAARELTAAERYLRAGQWEAEGAYPLTRGTVRNRRVGIAGLGRIGKAVAHRLESFGVEIAYFGRTRQADVPYAYYDDLVAMAREVDTLISLLPGGEATHHLIGDTVFEALGPRGILVNIGRGSVVDEAALVRALEEGTILNAGLDVFENEPHVPPELVALDRVVLLPHVGSASIHTRQAMAQLVVDNLKAWFEAGRALTPVPETPNPG